MVTTRSLSYTTEAVPDLPSVEAILGRAGTENFTVASALLPRLARRHLMAFYGFARLVDQIGDAYPGDRLAALDRLEADTREALADPTYGHALVGAAAQSVLQLQLDPAPLFRLIDANRMDQKVSSYRTFEDLVDYCSLSANPVGHLVLGAFGCFDPDRKALSDSICTGLQLVEHWQDVAEDAAAGRMYLPTEDLERFGIPPSQLTEPGPARPELRGLMVFEVARARKWLDAGRPLIGRLPGRARVAVAGFWAGGHAALDEIAARGFDVKNPPGPRSRTRLLRYLALGLRS
ncbi:MAG: squalene synthase HpnC [Acidimicrobiales bacterium]|nr:squalene synthase HpnC [Acidimicrobiales bacterium]